jgi:hypothetical protein
MFPRTSALSAGIFGLSIPTAASVSVTVFTLCMPSRPTIAQKEGAKRGFEERVVLAKLVKIKKSSSLAFQIVEKDITLYIAAS